MPSWDDLKYDYPRLYRCLLVLAVLGTSGVVVSSVPDNDATRAMGLIALAERGRAACSAVYWELRGAMGTSAPLPPQVQYGSVAGVDAEGAVLIAVPDQQVFVVHKVLLANIRITDLPGGRALVLGKRKADARVESYGAAAVIWVDGVPLNLMLINARVAVPDINPPTNIVEKVFAAHQWNRAKGPP